MADALTILIVTDKFKGSLTAVEACDSIKRGLLQGSFGGGRSLDISLLPMADGGDGTIDVIKTSVGGEIKYAEVYDPLMRLARVPYLVKGNNVYIEMAKCSGLQMLTPKEYNPIKASTYGLGQLILAGVKELTNRDTDGIEETNDFGKINDQGKKEGQIIIGIGGSATNDGGMGMLRALGYRFIRGNKDDVASIVKGTIAVKEAQSLGEVSLIEDSDVSILIKNRGTDSEKIKIMVASDVSNPLLGERGATAVYGSQKGADEKMVEELELGMQCYAKVCESYLGKSYSDYPGAGAAGGVGFALIGFMGAELVPGWKLLSELTDLESLIRESDLVITGEGNVDEQSISGKLIDGIASLTRKHNKRLWVYCGLNELNVEQLKHAGIERVFAISDIEINREVSIKGAKKLLEKISFDSATFLNLLESNKQTN